MNQKKNIEIRYVVEGNSFPLCIQTDMGLKLYIEIKKHEVEIGMYPLTTKSNCCGQGHNIRTCTFFPKDS